MDGSTSLNCFKNLQFVEGDTPQELQEKLISIKTPFNLLSMYSYKNGQRHIAWINMDRPFVNMKPSKDIKKKSVEELNKSLNK
jgi:hypothetical protein